MKPVRTWILLADGTRARIVCNSGPGKGLDEVRGMEFEGENVRSGDIMADRPGRTFDSAGAHRHAMEPPSDPQREAKRSFAAELVAGLQDQLQAHAFDRLVLVAAPATLGDIRKVLPKPLLAVVYGEIPKNLVHVPNKELGDHLADVLAV
ncbi:host attachment protein [Anderseniella sp. Alg231-50]|uniref:host attachment protein n=1 Tax=Anderseniella sp. Alg231-50 TaxID=1922226 RepID=UPI000D54CBBC